MVKAVNHDMASSAATTGFGGVKGALMGAVVPTLIGAAVVGLAAYVGAAAIGGLIPEALGGGGASWLATLSLPAKIGLGFAAVGAWIGGGFAAVGAAVGGLLGITKGASRVSHEQAKFNQRSDIRETTMAAQLQQAQMVGAQMGYQQGAQDAQVAMAERIQTMRNAAIEQHMAEMQEKHCKPCAKHVAAEMERRNASTSAQVVR